jgi:RNA polymerase sigma factor (sigma-70 family)
MKIDEPLPSTLAGALGGDLAALDALIAGIGPGVHALAVRMLGNREDAADASQEILLKVVTHLAAFRGEARFSTWVWSIARHHLLTASTRSRESPEVSLEALAERLESGLAFADRLRADRGEQVLTPQDKVEARQIALGCTQSMLMTLDREHRLAYVLDLVFGLDSSEAARIADITPEAHRQRLSRARARLDAFVGRTCGLASPSARCSCDAQVPAIAHRRATQPPTVIPLRAIDPREREQAEQRFAEIERLGDAAALFRAHPDYALPEARRDAIRSVLRAEGWLANGSPH